ncbi:MAG: hypothetical protein ABI551_04995 [Polyangiaceae bacterium]
MNRLVLASLVLGIAACGGQERPSRYPPREPGCAVTLYHGAPHGKTVNIGPVSASCNDDISDADCLRTLEDQVCKIGGDVVWGVDDTPKMDLDHKKFSGRAAHTRESPATASSNGAGSSSDAGI